MKKRKSVFLKVLLFAILIFSLGLALFFLNKSSINISGFSIISSFSETYENIPLESKIFFISAWLIFLSLLIGVFVRDKFLVKKKIEAKDLNLSYGKFETDLDVLYNILKTKQRIKIKTISDSFKVDTGQAMEWAKILEYGKLASIEYPGLFGDPELVLKN